MLRKKVGSITEETMRKKLFVDLRAVDHSARELAVRP